MPRKKVLIITYYWPPSGGAGVQRWVKFCKYLPEFDIEPIVLTVKDGTYPLVDKSLSSELDESLTVHRTKIIEPYALFAKLRGKTDKEVSTPATAFSTEGGLVQKAGVWIRSNFFIPDARIGWIPFCFSEAKKIISLQHIDIVITTGPPNSTHLIGTKIKKWNPDVRWIMDMRDPWSQIFYNETLPRTSLAQRIDEALEQKALKLADDVLVISEKMAELQQSIKKRNYHVVTNGFDHSDFEQVQKQSENVKFTVKYIGSMTEAAIPYSFFDALHSLSPQQKKEISLQFYGSYSSKIHEAVTNCDINELVSFEGYVPHLQAKSEMTTADLLLLVIPKSRHNQLILTGKLFDYIASQRPILYIGPLDGEAAGIIREYKLGVCVDYHQTKAIKKLLIDALKGSGIDYHKWEGKLKEHPFSRYSLTKKLSRIIG